MLSFPRKSGATPTWVQVSGFDAVSDPAAITTGATGESSGLLTFQTINTGVAVLDGYREDVPCFSRRLLDLLPDFDPAQDLVDLLLDVVSMPLNTAKYGLMAFVADAAPASRASWNAGGIQLYPNSATAINAGAISTTAQGTGTLLASNTNPCSRAFGRVFWHTEASSPTVRLAGGMLERVGADENPLTIVGAIGPAFGSSDPANWTVNVALQHLAAVDATDNIVQARLSVRRVRGGLPFP